MQGRLYNEMGGSIPKVLAEIAPNAKAYIVGAAAICLVRHGERVPVISIYVSPPDVCGADDMPLDVDQLDDAIGDLEHYWRLLDAQEMRV